MIAHRFSGGLTEAGAFTCCPAERDGILHNHSSWLCYSDFGPANNVFMYLEQQRKLATHVRAFLREKYDLDLPNIVIDQPPDVAMGEFALPLSFELAKRLRKAPRKIAEEIVAQLPLPEGLEKLEIVG